MYVIGTAGHVDHGKSTLVQALTGIDPDRLQEEKARGMTIDLGFAWLKLPGGQEVSIVDVPGHERFIKNMLAGVGGIDLALLVIAADEGVMPQTREHLAILDLLQVRSGVVAVTKCDLVDEDWLELVLADVEELLAPTALASAPLIPCSALTRRGLDQLMATVEAKLADTPPKRDIGRPRLAVDRVFTVAGFGTVVTGTLIDGTLKLAQEVELLPEGVRGRLRGLQTHRTKVEVARPGSRVAANISGVAVEDLHRGMVLTTPGWLRPAAAVDVSLSAVSGLTHPLRHNMTVSFHSGAAETEATLRLLDRDELRSGEQGWAQLRLAEPLALVRGDHYVIRSPNETLGGGTVVDTRARRHKRFDQPTIDALATLAKGSPEETLFALITRLEPVEVAALARQTEASEDQTRDLVELLVEAGRVMALAPAGAAVTRGTLLYSTPGFELLWERAETGLRTYFQERPLRTGMPKEELRSRVRLTGKVFTEVLACWLREGLLEEKGAVVSPPGHQVALTPVQQREADQFLTEVRQGGFTPQPTVVPSANLLAYLEESGHVVAVSEGVVYDAAVYHAMVERVITHLRAQHTVTLAQVRDMFGASRKYAQALLEHLDQRGVTRRDGDERVLR